MTEHAWNPGPAHRDPRSDDTGAAGRFTDKLFVPAESSPTTETPIFDSVAAALTGTVPTRVASPAIPSAVS